MADIIKKTPQNSKPRKTGATKNNPSFSDIEKKHHKLLSTLRDEGIFSISDYVTTIDLCECIDNFYTHSLTKDECLELSELFKEIATLFP